MVDTLNRKEGKWTIWCSQVIKKKKKTYLQSSIFPKMWQKPINPMDSVGCFNKVRKSSVLFWHPGITFNLCRAFCQVFEGHVHTTERPHFFFFFFFQKAWTFHDHIRNQSDFTLVMQNVMFSKKKFSVEKCSLFSCGVLFWFIALEKHLVSTGATKMGVAWVGKDVFLMLCCFLPLFCSPFYFRKASKASNTQHFDTKPNMVGALCEQRRQMIPLE